METSSKIQTLRAIARATMTWVLFLLFILPFTTATATSLDVTVTCEDLELGGGSTWRAYWCTAIATGGEPPYDFDWFASGVGYPTVFSLGPDASRALYNVADCYGPTLASGGTTVTDGASNQAFDSDTIILNCP